MLQAYIKVGFESEFRKAQIWYIWRTANSKIGEYHQSNDRHWEECFESLFELFETSNDLDQSTYIVYYFDYTLTSGYR